MQDQIEQEIDRAAEHLPEGYQIRLVVEKGWGGVEAVKPDGSTIPIDDPDACFPMLLSQAFAAACFDANGNCDAAPKGSESTDCSGLPGSNQKQSQAKKSEK